VAGFSIKIENKILSTLSHSLDYRFLTSAGGDTSFKNEWKTIPEHKLTYNVMFNPFEGFSLWANLTFLSPVEWSYFPNLEQLSDGFYKSNLDERFILDFSVRKWFWNNRLRFNLLFKNLLNNELLYHPLGARFNLSIFFTAEVVFSSIIE
jgi:outer membrane receptor for ferrienterochelin and colicin